MPQPRGCGLLFWRWNKAQQTPEVLLFRRDDKPTIPFPGKLDIIGGTVEGNETPKEATKRELSEELIDLRTGNPLVVEDHQILLFDRYTDPFGTLQTIYFSPSDFEISDMQLLEGQELVWVDANNSELTDIAFDFGSLIERFFDFLRRKHGENAS